MATNLSGISRTVNRGPARITTDTRPTVSFPGGEYATGRLGDQDSTYEGLTEQEIQENFDATVTGSLTEGQNPSRPSSVYSQEGIGPKGASDLYMQSLLEMKDPEAPIVKTDTGEAVRKGLEESRRIEKGAAAARATAAILRATGSVINANAKYQQTAANNAFAIQQAQQQALVVASQAQYKMLREQTKGKARGQSAMISAVAQGQAAGGDIAQTAISNEDVYAAEQSMMIEINAMRQVFGLETQQRVLESDIRMAEINRDLEVSQAIVGGVADVGMAGFGVMR